MRSESTATGESSAETAIDAVHRVGSAGNDEHDHHVAEVFRFESN